MEAIHSLDIRSDGPEHLVRAYPERAKDLIKASRRTFGPVSDLACHFLLPSGDRLSADWLTRTNNPYRHEIQNVADILNLTGVHALNLCYEWGCTSAVYANDEGPTLIRVLDWPFPRLGENAVLALQAGAAGEFHSVTWPGLSGIFQGIAPGRFAASINQAPMQRHGLTYAGDWVKNRRQVFRSSGLPPAHLLRQVFEQAANYEEAKRRLSVTRIALPAIYVLSGARPGEGCVIERTEDDHVTRPIDSDRVVAANHFETRLKAQGRGWRPRPIDSVGRANAARTLPLAAVDDQFTWFAPPIANTHSRLVMMANAATGSLKVFGTQGERRVTEILRAA